MNVLQIVSLRKFSGCRPAGIAVLAALLAGCSFSAGKPLPMNEQINRIYAMTRWQAKAKFSSRVQQKNIRGSVRMRHYPTTYSLSFSGPLGFGFTTLRGYWDDEAVHVTEKTGTEVVQLSDLGLPHPNILRRWMLGRPTSSGYDLEEDHLGRSLSFSDSGWEVRYLEYALVKGIWLPARIRLRGPEASSALIAIYAWKLKR